MRGIVRSDGLIFGSRWTGRLWSATGLVLTVLRRFGWESSCVRIRRGSTIGPVYSYLQTNDLVSS